MLGVVLGATACGHSDEDLGVARHERPSVALDRLDDPRALVVALAQPVAPLDGKLGARGIDIVQTRELTAGRRSDRVEQVLRLDTDGRGGFHVVHELGHPRALAPAPRRDDDDEPKPLVDPFAQGMEAVGLPGRLFVRPRYGRFIERRPEPGEVDRLRALAERVAGDDLELLAPFVAVEERGAGTVLGRRTRTLALSRRETPLPSGSPGGDDDPRRAWRRTIAVDELSGMLELDAETGVPLAARLEARYRVTRADAPLDVRLSLRQTARAAARVTRPADVDPAPHRARPTLERSELLDGLTAAPSAGGRP